MEWINLFDCIVSQTASLSLNLVVQLLCQASLTGVSWDSPGDLSKSEGVPSSTGSG